MAGRGLLDGKMFIYHDFPPAPACSPSFPPYALFCALLDYFVYKGFAAEVKRAPNARRWVKQMAGGRQMQRREKLDRLAHMLIRERASVRKAADAIGVSHMTAYRMLSEIEFTAR